MASKDFHIVIHPPQTEDGNAELKRRLAQLHAESVLRYVNHLKCPVAQKRELVNLILAQAVSEKEE